MMKQRITYLVQNSDDFTPEQLEVKGASLTLKDLPAAKEHRITFGLNELPREVGFWLLASDIGSIIFTFRYPLLIENSSVKRSNNGMSFTYDGHLKALTQQYLPSRHV